MGQDQFRIPTVTYFFRRPRSFGNHSIEFIFFDIIKRLGQRIKSRIVVVRHCSDGIFKRIFICFEAFFQQGNINHITGDINFIGIFFNSKRTIQTFHDCAILDNSHRLKHHIFKYFWFELPLSRCEIATTVSEATKARLMSHFPKLPPEKIRVIPVAISDKFIAKEKPFNQDCPRILQVGTAPNKNISRLADALEGLTCELWIIGNLSEPDRIRLNQRKIRYHSESGLSEEQVIERYVESDIISLVSTYEGFGMPILEGQAVGRPVVTSDLLSMPEVAGGGALLVDPFSASSIREGFQKVMNDATLRHHLVKIGKLNVKKFDPDTIASLYLDLYKEIITRSSKQKPMLICS